MNTQVLEATVADTLAVADVSSDVSPSQVASAVTDIPAPMLKQWLDEGCAFLVDVREPHEYEAERIPGALLMPLSMFDAALFPRISGKKVVLLCAVGKRSGVVGKQLLQAGFEEALHLEGGLKAWKAQGFETEE